LLDFVWHHDSPYLPNNKHGYINFDVNTNQKNDFTSAAVLEALMHLGACIRRARKARKSSLSQLEQMTRIHRTTLGRLELGDSGVSIGIFPSVLESLGELSDIELLVSHPETPRHQRTTS